MKTIWKWLPEPKFIALLMTLHASIVIVLLVGWTLTGGNCG